ncbi:hypothetical protein RBSWK_02971 [Rhodopirellula baltica SWK14]|uniref:Uncharacterized protein n=1 Tax=Rhodopirellula baltica SWK14 TaxID=993516 RepID=L7CH03_RHOBT|nr:hypothetical protein RBSWK_02971 [Rhodopirellula baltica SWK14]
MQNGIAKKLIHSYLVSDRPHTDVANQHESNDLTPLQTIHD